jgi:hypothetical protein
VFRSGYQHVLGVKHHEHPIGSFAGDSFQDQSHPQLDPRKRRSAEPLRHHAVSSVDDGCLDCITTIARIYPDVLDHAGHARALPGLNILESGHLVDRGNPAPEVLRPDVFWRATKLLDNVTDRHDAQVWQYRSATREI